MIKVKASLEVEELPKDIIIDIPKEYCNREEWNKYIKEYLFGLLKLKVKYDVLS